MDRPCEKCGAMPRKITEGPFAGSYGSHGYCALCSKDLCDACLKSGRCRETADHKHREEVDCAACDGTGVQAGLNDDKEKRKCLDCTGTGTVLNPPGGTP